MACFLDLTKGFFMADHKVTSDFIETMLQSRSTGIARDLKLNLRRLIEESSLTPEESALGLLAVATAVDHRSLASHSRERLAALGLSTEQIQEGAEVAALMGMLNYYYRFRHMLSHEAPEKEDEYKTAGLRMTSMARPALGKDLYEMLAFSVSVINGCENCVKAHEKVLREAGVSVDKIHDLARLAAVVNGLKVLERAA
jgi:alkyl hydroperoxide reductase subunit D